MENKAGQELQSIEVIFKGEGRTFELKNAIVQGVENKEDGRLISLICNYTEINDFIMAYTNFLVEAYHFLQDNNEDNNDDLLENLKNYTLGIFEGIEKGDFNTSEHERESEIF